MRTPGLALFRTGWRRLLLLAMVAAAAHLASVWALPRLIMARVAAGASSAERSGVYLPPPVTHEQRRIVMPSPDLLYATCAIDLREATVLRVHADPHGAGHRGYWSIALYAANSDNHFVLNDRAAAGRPIELRIVREGGAASASAEPAAGGRWVTTVTAPGQRGLLLMRLLIGDPARDLAAAEAARRTLRCERG